MSSGYLTPRDATEVCGKFLRVNGQRFLIKGVSYGTFAPNEDGALFPEPPQVARDFEAIAELEANTVRTYTPPPLSLLDEAQRSGLRLIVGIPWMQHVAFLDRRADRQRIRRGIRDEVRRLAAHPAPLLFALGNEIPPSIVRWYGSRRIERFLSDLYDEAKSAAPEAILTYVNYPPTEFLETPFFDVCAFNVFLHSSEQLTAYLARLHHIAGPRPLLISELGADSLRNGDERHAALVEMQLDTTLREGACGAVVFTWTDDWWRGGRAVDDWAFGLVDRQRRPKRAFTAVQRIFRSPSVVDRPAPRVSVVVCAYNEADTIDECLTALGELNYPDYEVIVVNDGSSDGTGDIAGKHPFARVINTANAGLSAARNVGLAHATGQIVAYTDADVRVDPEWLTYLVQAFDDPNVAAAGGPAIVPPGDSWFAQCVARAPGSPTHVLLDDRVAEHVPGCNCAFRREALAAIGGFNPIYLRAGDDVDACWRIQEQGWTIGFVPAALVWHRHRASTRAYWRQQIGYGEGEAWLMREHPGRFVKGRIAWNGHIYSPLPFIRSLRTRRVNAGPFGTAGFPSVYRTDAHPFAYLPHSGRWQVAWLLMLAGAVLAFVRDHPLALPLFAAAMATLVATVTKCVRYGLRSDVERLPRIGSHSRAVSLAMYRGAIAWLHFVQPFARLRGRLRGLMHPPPEHRRHSRRPAHADERAAAVGGVRPALQLFFLGRVTRCYWSERWIDLGDVLRATADRLRQQRAVRHIELDSGWWEDRDLTVVDSTWFRLDLRALFEDHGGGRCLHRFAVRTRLTGAAAVPVIAGSAVATALLYAGMAVSVTVLLVALVALILALGRIAATSRIVFGALHGVATDRGMLPIRYRRRTLHPTPAVPATPAGLTLTTRTMTHDATAPQAMAGDA